MARKRRHYSVVFRAGAANRPGSGFYFALADSGDAACGCFCGGGNCVANRSGGGIGHYAQSAGAKTAHGSAGRGVAI